MTPCSFITRYKKPGYFSSETGPAVESSFFDNHDMDKMNVNWELKEGFIMCGGFSDASFSIFNTVSLFSCT